VFRRLAVALLAFLLTAAAAGPAAAVDPQREAVKTVHEDDPPGSYAIGIGDLLDIAVWKNEELSVTVPVRPDGRISVPLLGDVRAAGMTPLALRQVLTDGFREFVTAPEVSVVIKEIRSQKVYITGEVANPGAYDLQPGTKVMQAVALAGGLTPYAKKRVVVLRDRDGRSDRRYEIDIEGIVSGRRPSDNLVLQPGDTVIVP
jgi:polysaccharide biosynthesis/export protein